MSESSCQVYVIHLLYYVIVIYFAVFLSGRCFFEFVSFWQRANIWLNSSVSSWHVRIQSGLCLESSAGVFSSRLYISFVLVSGSHSF